MVSPGSHRRLAKRDPPYQPQQTSTGRCLFMLVTCRLATSIVNGCRRFWSLSALSAGYCPGRAVVACRRSRARRCGEWRQHRL